MSKAMLNRLFGRTDGDITLHFTDGTTSTHSNFDDLADAAEAGDDPWVDLVTSEGLAVGLYAPGDASVVTPAPSIVTDDGMIYLIDGDPVPGQKQGVVLCP